MFWHPNFASTKEKNSLTCLEYDNYPGTIELVLLWWEKINKKCTLPFPIFELVHIQFI